MEKRNQKLRKLLQMTFFRLKDKDTLKWIEITSSREKNTLQVDPDNPAYLLEKKDRISRDRVPEYLEQKLAGIEKASVKIIERGSVITLKILPGDVKMEINTQDKQPQHQKTPEYGTRQDFIRAGEAEELLKAVGIMSPEGQIKADKRRKFYQVDRFIELIDEIIEEQPGKGKITILDCGCGKSYLSFVLNYWLTEKKRIPCKVIGIDDNADVIASSRKIQKQLGYHNMEFREEKIMDFQTSSDIDMVLSLHACDTATDEALALGLHLESKYIIAVPCCQAALHQKIDFSWWKAISKHNIFHNRLADIFTDGLRAAALEAHNYRVSVVEYVSPLETPKNILLRAVRGYHQPGAKSKYKKLQDNVSGEIPLENFLKTLDYRHKD